MGATSKWSMGTRVPSFQPWAGEGRGAGLKDGWELTDGPARRERRSSERQQGVCGHLAQHRHKAHTRLLPVLEALVLACPGVTVTQSGLCRQKQLASGWGGL